MSSCAADLRNDSITENLPSSLPLAKRVKRVKTGCVTCRWALTCDIFVPGHALTHQSQRIRRIKCDETKPHCQRCTSTGRKCDGYSSLPFSRRDLHAASLASLTTHTSSDESSGSETAPLSRIVSDVSANDRIKEAN